MSANKTVREYSVILICLAAVLYFISKGMFIYSIAPVFVILFFKTMADASFPFLLIFIIGALELKLPFYPHNMPNNFPFVAWFTAVAVLTHIIRKKHHKSQKLTALQITALALLAFDLVFLAVARGAKFSTSNLSGIWYIVIAFSFLTFIFSRNLYLTPNSIRTLIIFVLGGAFIKAIIQAFIIFTGTRFRWIEGFINVSTDSSVGDTTFGRRIYINRFSALNGVGSAITYFAINYLKTNKVATSYFILSIAFACAALSSYRYGLLMIILCFLLYTILFYKNKTKAFVTGLLFTAFVCLILYIIAPILPFQMQRGISFLPGINIPFLAKASATGTINWRIELWRYTLNHMHDYLILGRGLTRDYTSALSLSSIAQRRDYFIFCYYLHAYHSSLIGIIMDLGIIGAASFIIFISTTLRQLYHEILTIKQNSFFVIFLQFYLCYYVSRLIVSTISGGNVDRMIYDAFLNLALIYVMTASLKSFSQEDAPEEHKDK